MNLRKVWAVIRHEFLVNIRRWGFIILTLIVPLGGAVILFFGIFAGKAMSKTIISALGVNQERYGVVEQSGLFQEILPDFREDFIPYPDFETAKQAVRQGEVTAVLLIPSDYLQTGIVRVYSVGSGLTATTLEDSRRVRAFFTAHLVASYVPPELLARVEEPVTDFVPVQAPSEEGGPLSFAFRFIVPYILGMLLVMSIFVSSGYLLQGVAEEKENRLVEIVLSSISPMEWFLGKVIGLGAVGLTQVVVWMLSALALSGGSILFLALVIPPLPMRVWILTPIYYILGYLLFSTLYAGLGALGTSMRESQQVAGLVSIIAAVPFMVSGILFTNPNSPIIRAVSFFPLTAATMMLMRLPLADVPVMDIVISLVILVLSIPASLWVGAKLFRFGILIYGKRPGLKEIWAGLRSA